MRYWDSARWGIVILVFLTSISTLGGLYKWNKAIEVVDENAIATEDPGSSVSLTPAADSVRKLPVTEMTAAPLPANAFQGFTDDDMEAIAKIAESRSKAMKLVPVDSEKAASPSTGQGEKP